MEAYYASLAARGGDADQQRRADEIARPKEIDLSAPYRSSFPNALSLEANRQVYGSDASAHQPALDSSNLGHRMLQRMGWEDGTGLGKHRSGIVEPVQAEVRTRGLGVGAERHAAAARTAQEADDRQQTKRHSVHEWPFLGVLKVQGSSFPPIHPISMSFPVCVLVLFVFSYFLSGSLPPPPPPPPAFAAFQKRKIAKYQHRPNPMVRRILLLRARRLALLLCDLAGARDSIATHSLCRGLAVSGRTTHGVRTKRQARAMWPHLRSRFSHVPTPRPVVHWTFHSNFNLLAIVRVLARLRMPFRL